MVAAVDPTRLHESAVEDDEGQDSEDKLGTRTGVGSDFAATVVEDYECALKDGRYDGLGRIEYTNNNTYIGDMARGKLHGHGTMQWHDQVKYEGQFNHNIITGFGVYTWPDGSRYCGMVHRGKRHGYGVLVKGEVRYQGHWHEGYKHGLGVLTFNRAGDYFYEGEFVRGVKEGWGKVVYPSGSRYEGQWRKNKKEGFGVMQWVVAGPPASAGTQLPSMMSMGMSSSDDLLTAEPKENDPKIHVFSSSDGAAGIPIPESHLPHGRVERYEGSWKDGRMHGYGTYSWLCKARPRPPTQSGVTVGTSLGTLETSLQGENTFKGWFEAGKRHGQGVLCLADGTVFEGFWVDNMKDGRGVLRHPDGTVDLLDIRANAITAKKVLISGQRHGGPKEGDVQRRSQNENKAGLTLSNLQIAESIFVDVEDIADGGTKEERKASSKHIVDLLLRNMAPLRYLYRFYAQVTPSLILRSPSDRNRAQLRDKRFEELVKKKAAQHGAEGALGLAKVQAAEAAAFSDLLSKPPSFVRECDDPELTVNNPHLTPQMTDRERVMVQLQAVSSRAAQKAVEMANRALEYVSAQADSDADGAGGSRNEVSPCPDLYDDPIPALPRQFSWNQAPRTAPPLDEPCTLLRLGQFWALLREAGILSHDFTLWKADSVISKVLQGQAYVADDDLWNLSDDSESGDECDTLPPDTPEGSALSREGSKGSRRGAKEGTPRRSSLGEEKPSSKHRVVGVVQDLKKPKIFRKGMVAKIQKNRSDIHDPSHPMMFSTFVQAIVRIAHHKISYTSGYLYQNATQEMRLVDRVQWLFSVHFGPLIEALKAAGHSTAGPSLGIPKLVEEPLVNMTRQEPRHLHSRGTPYMLGGRGAATETSSRNTSFVDDRPGTAATKPDSPRSDPDTPQTHAAPSRMDSCMTEIISMMHETTRTTDGKESRHAGRVCRVDPIPEPTVTVTDRVLKGYKATTMSVNLTCTSVTHHGMVNQYFQMLRSALPEDLRQLTIITETYTCHPLPHKPHSMGSTHCLGIRSPTENYRNREWMMRDEAAWNKYNFAVDVLEEWTHQEEEKQRRRRAAEGGEESEEDTDTVTREQMLKAKDVLTNHLPPLLLKYTIHPHYLMRSRPALEVLESHSEYLISLFTKYATNGKLAMVDLVRMLRDYRVVDRETPAPPPKKKSLLHKYRRVRTAVKKELEQASRSQRNMRKDSRKRSSTTNDVPVSPLLAPVVSDDEDERYEEDISVQPDPPLCTLPIRLVLRYPLWYCMGIDTDQAVIPCHVYSDPRFERQHQNEMDSVDLAESRGVRTAGGTVYGYTVCPPTHTTRNQGGGTLGNTAAFGTMGMGTMCFSALFDKTAVLFGLFGNPGLLATPPTIPQGMKTTVKSAATPIAHSRDEPAASVSRLDSPSRSREREREREREQPAPPQPTMPMPRCWINPPPAVTDEIAQYEWEYCLRDLPILYLEFLEILCIIATVVFTSQPAPYSHMVPHAMNGIAEEDFTTKIEKLLRHMEKNGLEPPPMVVPCLEEPPLIAPPLLPVKHVVHEEDPKKKKK